MIWVNEGFKKNYKRNYNKFINKFISEFLKTTIKKLVWAPADSICNFLHHNLFDSDVI